MYLQKTLRHYIARDLYENEVVDFKTAPGQFYPMHIGREMSWITL